MVAWRYEISLLVLKKSHFTRSLRSLVKYFSTLEEKLVSPRGLVISSIYSVLVQCPTTLLESDSWTSQIPQNTRINTSRAVRVWSEWSEERNDLIQIIGDSETIPQVNPEILNIADNDET